MAFELDPCRVRTGGGELLVQGFVREYWGDGVELEVEHEAGSWVEPGDVVVLEILSSLRGTCTFDAVVAGSGARRVELSGLELQQTVQMRTAVRVPTAIPVRLRPVVAPGTPGEEAPADVDAVVIDVSATGVRLRLKDEVEEGARFAFRLDVTRVPLDLQVEAVRVQEFNGDTVLGCRLVGTSERQADELYRYVLEEQRRQLALRSS